MRAALFSLLSGVLVLSACGGQESPPAGAAAENPEGASKPAVVPSAKIPGMGRGVTLSGPFTHDNLAIYFVEDSEAESLGEFITLREGIETGVVKVTEKKSAQVSELLISNTSGKPCFVQAGDVVKGGQQDRTIARDFVIPPQSKDRPLASFCVERGRWAGNEVFGDFRGNANSQYLKVAIQSGEGQGVVWDNVQRAKVDLASNNSLSPSKSTSLVEELEKPKITERKKGYLDALLPAIKGRDHAVGMIWAINGELVTADVYGDPGLFAKLFPAVLESAALEAMSVEVAKGTPKLPTPEACRAFLAEASEGKEVEEAVAAGAPHNGAAFQLEADQVILDASASPQDLARPVNVPRKTDGDLEKFTNDKGRTVRYRYEYKGRSIHIQSHKRRK